MSRDLAEVMTGVDADRTAAEPYVWRTHVTSRGSATCVHSSMVSVCVNEWSRQAPASLMRRSYSLYVTRSVPRSSCWGHAVVRVHATVGEQTDRHGPVVGVDVVRMGREHLSAPPAPVHVPGAGPLVLTCADRACERLVGARALPSTVRVAPRQPRGPHVACVHVHVVVVDARQRVGGELGDRVRDGARFRLHVAVCDDRPYRFHGRLRGRLWWLRRFAAIISAIAVLYSVGTIQLLSLHVLADAVFNLLNCRNLRNS